MARLKVGDTFTSAGRVWTVLDVGEMSYAAQSGEAYGYFSFASLEGDQENASATPARANAATHAHDSR